MKTIRTVQIIEDTAMAAAESKERTNKIIAESLLRRLAKRWNWEEIKDDDV